MSHIDISQPFEPVYAGPPAGAGDAVPPPPPPPAPPEPPAPRRHGRGRSRTATALIALAALALGLLGGHAIDTNEHATNDTTSQPLTLPGGANQPGPGGARAAAHVARAVVNIDTTVSGGAAAGTGMVITSSGEILTNNHVINGANTITVELADASKHSARVLGYDVTDDVALIKIDTVSNLPTISTAAASTLSVGDAVIAMGNALGQGGAPSVVSGTITALDQRITASDQGGADAETLHGLIEMNAPIQPGDSGGPLANMSGKVIGMDTAASTSRGFGFRRAQGASDGYAIPIEQALAIAHAIESGDASATVHIGTRGILGVALQSEAQDGNGFGDSGAVVTQTEDGSPAADAGIDTGSTIVAVDGHSIASVADLEAVMSPHHPGDRVSVTWTDSSGGRHTATIRLMTGPPR